MFNSVFLGIISVLGSGLLYFYSENFHSAWYLMWVAPVPVLLYAYKNTLQAAAIVAFCANLFRGFNVLIGEQSIGPKGSFILSSIEEGFAWTLIILLTRHFMRGRANPIGVFLYPALVVLWEWFQSIGPEGTFATIAYSQLPVLPVVQIASITGFLGVSFILSLFSATIAYLVLVCHKKHKTFWLVGCSFALIATSIVYGFYRVHTYDVLSFPSMQVGLVSIQNSSAKIFDPINAEILADEYVPFIHTLAKQGAHVVLLPEETSLITPTNRLFLQNKWAQIANSAHVTLIVGLREFLDTVTYNIAWIFHSDGTFLGEYKKMHLVPGVEATLTPGHKLFDFPLDNHRAAVAICRDMDYPEPSRQYAAQNVGILFIPAWDFGVDAYVHAQGAHMRGIENGLTTVRCARNGLLNVISPIGKVIANVPAVETPVASLFTITPIALQTSFYAHNPHIFIALVGGLFLLGLLRFLVMEK